MEYEDHLSKICDMRGEFLDVLESYIERYGFESLSASETGEVVDIIKDLCEAEKDLKKACYYSSVTEAMKRDAYPSNTEKHHAAEHKDMNAYVSDIRDIWKSADTDTKKKMKAMLVSLTGEMAI